MSSPGSEGNYQGNRACVYMVSGLLSGVLLVLMNCQKVLMNYQVKRACVFTVIRLLPGFLLNYHEFPSSYELPGVILVRILS